LIKVKALAQIHKVSRLLSDQHLADVHALLLDRRRTIDDAYRMVRSLGYKISRTAVGGYARVLRTRSALLARELAIGSEGAARERLRRAALQLRGEALIALAVQATVLLLNDRMLKRRSGLRPAPRRGSQTYSRRAVRSTVKPRSNRR
jgi:hypothetical protein